MKELVLNVEGMHCEGCENRIRNALKDLDGIDDVIASHTDGTVKVTLNGDVKLGAIKEIIEDIGFEVKED